MNLKRLDIQKQLEDREIFELSLAQMQKDMNIDLQHLKKAEKQYDALYIEIKALVEYSLKNSAGEFFNMLYRIDISESMIQKALSMKMDYPIEKITQMIILREVQKVLFRKFYS